MNTSEILIKLHWELANNKNWEKFAEILSDDLKYNVPQTKEWIDSGVGYLEMFRTWPGPWHAEITNLVCQANKGICIINFITNKNVEVGVSVFEIQDNKIARVTDYWPAPYEPPERKTKFIRRE